MAQRLAAIVLLAAPSLVLAQTAGNGTVTVAENSDQDKIVSVAECLNQKQDNLQITWTFNSGGAGPFTLLASDQTSCPQSSTNGTTVTAHTVPLGSSATNNFADPQTVANRITAVFGANCPTTATVLFVCVIDSGNNIITGSIPLDLAAPPKPENVTVTPGDSALNVSWSQGSGSVDGGTGAANGFRVYCTPNATAPAAGTPITNRCADITGQGTTSTRVNGLSNGTEYAIEVTAVTLSGNESAHSDRALGTPIEIQDFWRLYRTDGGQEQGGCAAGAGGLVALAALAPLAWRRLRRRP